MKLAIEHLQQSIAQAERALSDAKNAMAATQRQLDEHTASASLANKKLADFQAALNVIRAQSTLPIQLQKSEPRETRQTLKLSKSN